MAWPVRFLTALLLGLGVLTSAAAWIVIETTRDWLGKDLASRAELVLNGLRPAFIDHWSLHDPSAIGAVLSEIARDERIMGAAACDPAGYLIAATPDYPSSIACPDLLAHVAAEKDAAAADWSSWHAVVPLRGGDVHLSALPVMDGPGPIALVALVHDLSFVKRRETKVMQFIIVVFALLAIAAAALTIVAARLSWLGWSRAFREFIQGGRGREEFGPLLRDVRALVARIDAEASVDAEGQGAWTPKRLKYTLGRHLHGEKVVIVANREPYIHTRGPGGDVTVVHPASGLVTALEPVMRACSGVWVAHGAGSADRETADASGRVSVPPGEGSYSLRRIWLSKKEERGYYYGFSNEGLWPLCHLAHTRPAFRADDFATYEAVNRRFAEVVCEEVDRSDPIILVQDYHFALAPRFIRERLPRATILTFWHIPWPNAERFGICPWRDELLQGMLGSSIVGFHTQQHSNNFLDAVDAYLEARIDRERFAVVQQRRPTLIRAYPISIEWPNRRLDDVPAVPECRAGVISELGLHTDALIGVGVDRLDYTKGVEERLLAVERLLEKRPELRGRFSFIQLAAPSRTEIDQYRRLNEAVEQLASRINAKFGQERYQPVILRRAHHEPPTVFRYLRAADVCYVSSLHDGMNLVAKEFVAARDDLQGVLVLSQFTGAARELTEALIVNPYDIEEASAALHTALTMHKAEQRERLMAMRSLLAHFNVYRWAGRMLIDAAQVRRRERLVDRLTATASNTAPQGSTTYAAHPLARQS